MHPAAEGWPGQARPIVRSRVNVKRALPLLGPFPGASPLVIEQAGRHGAAMTKPGDKLTREERLAAKLRENLHRRKAQSRALGSGGAESDGILSDAGQSGLGQNDSGGLSKPSSES